MLSDLLPKGNSTLFERAFANSLEFGDDTIAAIDGITDAKLVDVPSSFVAPLLLEYGVAAVARFHDDQEALVRLAFDWQQIRGTPAAWNQAQAWNGFSAEVDDLREWRRRWNRYHADTGNLPEDAREVEHLLDAEFLARFAQPERSVYFRGFYDYDLPAKQWSKQAWSNSMWSASSGVKVPGGETKWSFKRTHQLQANSEIAAGLSAQHLADWADTPRGELMLARLDDSGVARNITWGSFAWDTPDLTWESLVVPDGSTGDPSDNQDDVSWNSFPWETPGVSWDGITDSEAFYASRLLSLNAYIGFFDETGALIGAQRVIRPSNVTGEVAPGDDLIALRFIATTPFKAAPNAKVAGVGLLLGAYPKADLPQMQRWIGPDDIMVEYPETLELLTAAYAPVDFTMTHSIRERVEFTAIF
jgi:hypothetical protein